MSGKITSMIDDIIQKRAKGNETIAILTRAKMMMKGINPDKFTADSEDDPEIIEKLRSLAESIGVTVWGYH